MFSIFNGRSRTLGKGVKADVYMQVTVGLREHLHLFKGAKLAVFMCIALHADEHGRSHPPLILMERETGFASETIARALHDLYRVEIDGNRVLLCDSGTGDYLVFPCAGEATEAKL